MITEQLPGLRRALVDLIRQWHLRGWSQATSTNYSFREPGATGFFISRSGVDKSRFSPRDLMRVNAEGIPEDTEGRPSAETPIHAFLYEHAHINVVLHTHSVAATVLSLRAGSGLYFEGLEMLKAIRGTMTHATGVMLPVFENTQDMQDLVRTLRGRSITAGYGFLLAGHGLYAWGRDLQEAKRHVEAFEFLLECQLYHQILSPKN